MSVPSLYDSLSTPSTPDTPATPDDANAPAPSLGCDTVDAAIVALDALAASLPSPMTDADWLAWDEAERVLWAEEDDLDLPPLAETPPSFAAPARAESSDDAWARFEASERAHWAACDDDADELPPIAPAPRPADDGYVSWDALAALQRPRPALLAAVFRAHCGGPLPDVDVLKGPLDTDVTVWLKPAARGRSLGSGLTAIAELV